MKISTVSLLILSLISSLVAQQIPTQYVIAKPNNQLVTPVITGNTPGSVSIIVRPYYAAKPNKLERVRQAFGTVPFLVVTADKEPFVLVSQDQDILIVGHPAPIRIVMRESQGYSVANVEGSQVIVPITTTYPIIVEQVDRLEIKPQIPTWLPSDILIGRTQYGKSLHEVVYRPNQKYAAGTGSTTTIYGCVYRKYTLFIFDR